MTATDKGGVERTDQARRPRATGLSIAIAMARRSGGLVSRAQLLAAGVSVHSIEYQLKIGLMVRLHRGVYRLGPISPPLEQERAALLRCGPSAVLSHKSAAILWGFGRASSPQETVEVTVESGRRKNDAGLRIHRVAPFSPDEKRCHRGVPLTSPARTLLDIAGTARPAAAAEATAAAMHSGLVDREQIERQLALRSGARGTRVLRDLLASEDGLSFTRSEAEFRFLDLVKTARLPTPAVNVTVQRIEVDFLWRRARLVVEMDGFAFHSSRAAFERDRRRDLALSAAGLRVIRITWRQLTREPFALVARLSQALMHEGTW